MNKYAIKVDDAKVSEIESETAEWAARAYSEECGPDSEFGFFRAVKEIDSETRGIEWAIIKTDGGMITAELI